jgi:hypothetical protein
MIHTFSSASGKCSKLKQRKTEEKEKTRGHSAPSPRFQRKDLGEIPAIVRMKNGSQWKTLALWRDE